MPNRDDGQGYAIATAGTVTWRGIDGVLRGKIGSGKAIGAFQGNNGTSAYVDGFVGGRTSD